MVTIIGLEKRKAADGKEFNVMNLQGSIEVAISKATGKPYLTARKTSIPCTFDDVLAKTLIGQSLPGVELYEFGLALFTSYLSDQNFELVTVNMNPENGAPYIMIRNPQKALFYIWVKTDLAPNIPVYVPNKTHDVITEISRKYKAILGFASITIRCASQESSLIPKCGGEFFAVLNEFEEI